MFPSKKGEESKLEKSKPAKANDDPTTKRGFISTLKRMNGPSEIIEDLEDLPDKEVEELSEVVIKMIFFNSGYDLKEEVKKDIIDYSQFLREENDPNDPKKVNLLTQLEYRNVPNTPIFCMLIYSINYFLQ